jgi:hypothetical protein
MRRSAGSCVAVQRRVLGRATGVTLRSCSAESQDESPGRAIHKSKVKGAQLKRAATKSKPRPAFIFLGTVRPGGSRKIYVVALRSCRRQAFGMNRSRDLRRFRSSRMGQGGGSETRPSKDEHNAAAAFQTCACAVSFYGGWGWLGFFQQLFQVLLPQSGPSVRAVAVGLVGSGYQHEFSIFHFLDFALGDA